MNTPSKPPGQEQLGETAPPSGYVAAAPPPVNAQLGPYADRFGHRSYILQKQFFKMFGGVFRFYDPSGNLVFYSKQKAFKLKEDIRLFTGEDMAQEVLSIHARNIIDFSATYDVTDTASGQKIGALRRKGLKSLLQDEWLILDVQDREMGVIREESTALAVIRRFIDVAKYVLPQSFIGTLGNRQVLLFTQNYNPFLAKIHVDFTPDQDGLLDRRLGIAAAVLLCAIEGKQR